MNDELELALEAARDADHWELAVRFGEDVSLSDGQFRLVARYFNLAARYFNTVVHFGAPDSATPYWNVGREDIRGDDDEDREIEWVGALSVAQVIDTVPSSAEPWVLAITHEVAAAFAEDDAQRTEGTRLLSEWEQGEAHSARWRERSAARYGDMFLYDFPDDADLRYERGETGGRPRAVGR